MEKGVSPPPLSPDKVAVEHTLSALGALGGAVEPHEAEEGEIQRGAEARGEEERAGPGSRWGPVGVTGFKLEGGIVL